MNDPSTVPYTKRVREPRTVHKFTCTCEQCIFDLKLQNKYPGTLYHIQDTFLNVLELRRLAEWQLYHKCNRLRAIWRKMTYQSQDVFRVFRFSTSVGYAYDAWCGKCNVYKDITDYSTW